jgi:Ca2+-binding EF-hand superfamily protein
MLCRPNIIVVTVVIAVLLAIWAMLGAGVAQRAAVPKSQDRWALGEEDVKHLLLLMDSDKSGKVSKQEFRNFMEEEFERLDKDKSGDLDLKELTQSNFRVNPTAGK